MNYILILSMLSMALAAGQSIGGCPAFPSDNVWNHPVDTLPLDSGSPTYVATIGATKTAHADFGAGLYDGGPIGIPYVIVPGTQPKVAVTFQYADESDKGPYPIPYNAPVEGGNASTGDRHVLVVDKDNCVLYEMFSSYLQADGSWKAGSGAKFDLKSDTLRPAGWTSADAAGLPILPGLVRYDEVASGEIRHALRFTAPQTRKAYLWPARHYASSRTGKQYPPMGLRFRLKANYDITKFSPEVQVILKALKKYGMILADNGSSWYISGAPDDRWNNDHLHELSRLTGANFEAVDESSLIVNTNSGATKTVITAAKRAVPHAVAIVDEEVADPSISISGRALVGGEVTVNLRDLGFSDPIVMMGGKETEVIEATASTLRIRVPGELFGSDAVPVVVRSRADSSAPRPRAITVDVQ